MYIFYNTIVLVIYINLINQFLLLSSFIYKNKTILNRKFITDIKYFCAINI
jgi:hypothetical protein